MPYTTLLSPAELASLIDTGPTVVVDCRFSLADPAAGRREYEQGHLPGAVYAHLDEHLSSPITAESGRHPMPDPMQFADQLAAWGVDPSVQLVAYDNSGGAFAARLWWLARWVGLEKVAVLDGGLAAWQAAGYPLTTDPPNPQPSAFTPAVDNSRWVSTAELLRELEAGAATLIDARERERYRGEVEPIDPVAGHVPGAVNLPFKQNLDTSGDYLAPQQLRERFAAALTITPPERVVHMCGSGVTACVNLLAMEHAGLAGSRLYAGSWSEYIRDPARPVARD